MRPILLTKIVYSLVSLMLFALVVSNSLIAATTQGPTTPFATSGTVDITVSSGDDIIIFGLQTVSFGTWNIGDGNLASNQDVCIGKSGVFEPYAIQATGDGAPGDPSAFTLSNGVQQINYDVYWNDQSGTGGQVQLPPATILFGQNSGGFFRSLINRFRGFQGQPCAPGGGFFSAIPNANLEVRINNTELSSAAGGNYTGVLTLLLIPL